MICLFEKVLNPSLHVVSDFKGRWSVHNRKKIDTISTTPGERSESFEWLVTGFWR